MGPSREALVCSFVFWGGVFLLQAQPGVQKSGKKYVFSLYFVSLSFYLSEVHRLAHLESERVLSVLDLCLL